MSAFLAFAFDVPRRLARGKLLWVFVVVALLWLVLPALLGAHADASGEKVITFGGKPWTDDGPSGGPPMPLKPDDMVTLFIGGLFGVFLACYAGPFSGLILLADAVPQAFSVGAAEFNVPKPVPRSTIVLARHVGALMVSFAFLALLIGASTAIAYGRTQLFAARVLWAIPIAFGLFGLLHAIGSFAAASSRNAFVGAFAALGIWFLGTITQWVADFEKTLGQSMPIVRLVAIGCRAAHRTLPRANELPALAEALIGNAAFHAPWNPPGAGKGAFEVNGDVRELVTQTLVWWGIALGLACLSVRKRDF